MKRNKSERLPFENIGPNKQECLSSKVKSLSEYQAQRELALQANKEQKILNAFLNHAKKLDW